MEGGKKKSRGKQQNFKFEKQETTKNDLSDIKIAFLSFFFNFKWLDNNGRPIILVHRVKCIRRVHNGSTHRKTPKDTVSGHFPTIHFTVIKSLITHELSFYMKNMPTTRVGIGPPTLALYE